MAKSFFKWLSSYSKMLWERRCIATAKQRYYNVHFVCHLVAIFEIWKLWEPEAMSFFQNYLSSLSFTKHLNQNLFNLNNFISFKWLRYNRVWILLNLSIYLLDQRNVAFWEVSLSLQLASRVRESFHQLKKREKLVFFVNLICWEEKRGWQWQIPSENFYLFATQR